jgi:hypothetical protein
MAEIRTNIAVTETESQAFKKFQTTSTQEQPLSQGDGVIRISPFDDYFLFTLYEDTGGEDTPIDLSNVGVVYLSFIGDSDEIRIPYYTNVEDLDLSQGQVLFRISAEDSKKILKLNNDNFYISTRGVSPEGDVSDESVLYTGKFLSLTAAARESLTAQIQDLQLQYSRDTVVLQTQLAATTKERDGLAQLVADQNTTIQALKNSNQEMSNVISEISKTTDSQSQTAAVLQDKAKDAQALAQAAQNKAGQTAAVQAKQQGKNSKTVVQIAASSLQRSSI